MSRDLLKKVTGTIASYDGPDEIRPFADFLEAIGEVVIAFSRLERRLTWGIESCLKITIQQADAIQETIISVSTRISLFDTLASAHIDPASDFARQLDSIVKNARKLNDYRNLILHGPWYGVSESYEDGSLVDRAAMKSKYAPLGARVLTPKQRYHSVQEMRERAKDMLCLGTEIHRWIMTVIPDAHNRVP